MSQTVLVTGGLGYLGGRILGHLDACGPYTLRASTRRPPRDRPAWAGTMRVVRADLLDDGALAAVCDGVDTVLHLAAMNARDCAADPERAHIVNVTGTAKLLAAAETAGVRRFVYVSTAHVYGAPLRGEISEETVPRPAHPYATTHRAAEELVLLKSKPPPTSRLGDLSKAGYCDCVLAGLAGELPPLRLVDFRAKPAVEATLKPEFR